MLKFRNKDKDQFQKFSSFEVKCEKTELQSGVRDKVFNQHKCFLCSILHKYSYVTT